MTVNAKIIQSSEPVIGPKWQLELGANFIDDHTVKFKVWAPSCKSVEVKFLGREDLDFKLHKDEDGYYVGEASSCAEGMLYQYKLNDQACFPDPVSRFLPEGPAGPSLLVNPKNFQWTDQAWQGLPLKGQVIYEVHVGTFTQEGTYQAATQELDELKRIGITLIELMPIMEFPGKWNTGYDIANSYAPSHVYGDLDSLKNFINKAHKLGIGVILDVVFNHFGPVNCYYSQFSPYYLSMKYMTDWGNAINFDGSGSKEVRHFFISNILYWLAEFHVDGFRLDSTQDIYDNSHPHILTEIVDAAKTVAGNKKIIFIAENLIHDIKLIRSKQENGYGLDGIWSDDFHNVAMVALLGKSEAYYSDYRGTSQEFISLIKKCFLYQGQVAWTGKKTGTLVTDEPSECFIHYLQNHDLISNSLKSERFSKLTSESLYRVITALLLLAPQTPMLFMGQEFASSSHFSFFADHNGDIELKAQLGRKKFLEMYPSLTAVYESPEAHKYIPEINSTQNFEKSKLNFEERQINKEIYQMHIDLLKIRREDPAISQQDRFKIDGAVINNECFVIRYYVQSGDDRLMIVNFGKDLKFTSLSEPLLAPPIKASWDLIWSTESIAYNGYGMINPTKDNQWYFPAHCLFLLKSFSEVKGA